MNIAGNFSRNLINWHTIISVQAFAFLGIALISSTIIDLINRDKFVKEAVNNALPSLRDKEYRDKGYYIINRKILTNLFAGAIVIYSCFSNAIHHSLSYYLDSHIKSFVNNKVLETFIKSALQTVFPLLFLGVIFEKYMINSSIYTKYKEKMKIGNLRLCGDEEETITNCCLNPIMEYFQDFLIMSGAVFAGGVTKDSLLHFLPDAEMPPILKLVVAYGVSSLILTAIFLSKQIWEVLREDKEEMRKMLLIYIGSKFVQVPLYIVQGILFNNEGGILAKFFDKNSYIFSLSGVLFQIIISACSSIFSNYVSINFIVEVKRENGEPEREIEKKCEEYIKVVMPFEGNFIAAQLFGGI